MLARKSFSSIAYKTATAPKSLSARSTLSAAIEHTNQSAALSFRISRLFSTSSPRPRTSPSLPQRYPPQAHVPRPIPLDIGNGPIAAGAGGYSAAGSAAGVAGLSSSSQSASAGRHYQTSSGGFGSAFRRFSGPIINVIIYSTAASLCLHLAYHYLALEEYRITSNKKVAELEAEIAALRSNTIKHSSGGRGEFV
ncbi:hypothetical protein BGZ99_009080 [Dissophora globulifera]|uniref:Uncharacterized protein n=1 Tax=Dissophora globulifera TaxID=979702 RepID=A0A9P6UP21_9FUNG|nr:hypothetical protein BGZ99_009080 [Dissophora globulifera]